MSILHFLKLSIPVRIFLIFGFVVFLTSFSVETAFSNQEYTVNLNPIADAFVNSLSPNENYGLSNQLQIDGSPKNITYLKFDLSQLTGKTVKSARLGIHITNSSSGTQNIKNVSSTAWSESTLNFNNKPTLGSIIKSFSGGSASTWKEIDLTSMIQNKTGQITTIAIDSTSSNGLDFNSRESNNKPVLKILYEDSILTNGLTPTLMPTSTPSISPVSPTPIPFGQVLAFPGAEGFGANTPGGRGGRVIEVTNLNDNGSGSLREAINATGARTIVFKVGGIINLSSNLTINNPYITIAGQTAPGGGITLRGGTLIVKTNDVIIRHIRIRLGDMAADNDTVYLGGASNVIFDHVSASWSIDETFSAADSKNITIQWSIISEPLNDAGHVDGSHGFCSLLRGSSNLSVHHNLYAHCVRRSPQVSFKGNYQEKVQIINNLMYDYIESGTRIKVGDTNNPTTGYTDVINNRYLPKGSILSEIFLDSDLQNAKLYINGNIGPRRPDNTMDQWALVTNKSSLSRSQLENFVPFSPTGVTTYDALTSAEMVLNQAGATLPQRDSVDQRIINEVKTKTGQIINCVASDGTTRCQKNAGGWPVINPGVSPKDTDHDGMPDNWEILKGLNPNLDDSKGDWNNDGYTNIEEYINNITV